MTKRKNRDCEDFRWVGAAVKEDKDSAFYAALRIKKAAKSDYFNVLQGDTVCAYETIQH